MSALIIMPKKLGYFMNRVMISSILFLVQAVVVQAADLKSLKDVYDKKLEEIVFSHGPKVLELQDQYAKALGTIRPKVRTDGNLDKTKALMAEIERYQKDKTIPASPAENEIAEIRSLQVTYVRQFADLELDKARKIITLATQYDAALDRLQKDLTRTDKIDEATAVQSERNKVKDSDYLTAANRVIESATAKQSIVAVTDKPEKKAGLAPLNRTMELSLGKGVKMKLTLIQAGKFLMGSPATESGRMLNELPQHEVTISKPFYMGIYEVKQEEYETLMGGNPSKIRGRNLPVEYVTWDMAREFCEKLSAKSGKTVRLPTEAEWEYACRAGTKTRFSFGDNDADLHKYGNYWDRSLAWDLFHPKNDSPSDGHDKTAPVGSYKSNAWGLYDMHGNVTEWCQDWFGDNYYDKSPAVDPRGPDTGLIRVQRGGSLLDPPNKMRSAWRAGNNPTKPAFMDIYPYVFGFRVVVDAE
jgi:formylglycine-generating enzyme required for sulfatase activity